MSQWYNGKIYAPPPPWQPEFGPEERLFDFWKFRGVFFSLYIINFVRRISETAMGGEGAI
jgi:hypothetical protein